jgi:hypothetical protein
VGPYQPNQYGDVILPFTMLRRLDCILEPTKDQVLAEYKKVQSQKIDPGVVLKSTFKLPGRWWWWWCWPPQRPKHQVHGGRGGLYPGSLPMTASAQIPVALPILSAEYGAGGGGFGGTATTSDPTIWKGGDGGTRVEWV